LCSNLQFYIIVDDEMENRARKLEKLGFALFDALHIACAEKGRADILLTTDNGFMRRASRNHEILKVKVENPVKWLMEKIDDDPANVKS
jgi:predicted nucleic acid-binding protein